jgi:hypothetical protein
MEARPGREKPRDLSLSLSAFLPRSISETQTQTQKKKKKKKKNLRADDEDDEDDDGEGNGVGFTLGRTNVRTKGSKCPGQSVREQRPVKTREEAADCKNAEVPEPQKKKKMMMMMMKKAPGRGSAVPVLIRSSSRHSIVICIPGPRLHRSLDPNVKTQKKQHIVRMQRF